MASLSQRIKVELDNISQVLTEIERIKGKENKATVELAGIATFIHNFYSGIENILNQILREKNITVPKTESWHKSLLALSIENEIITKHLRDTLSEYLAFRHFFVHAYGFMLEERELLALVNNIDNAFIEFNEAIKKYLID